MTGRVFAAFLASFAITLATANGADAEELDRALFFEMPTIVVTPTHQRVFATNQDRIDAVALKDRIVKMGNLRL